MNSSHIVIIHLIIVEHLEKIMLVAHYLYKIVRRFKNSTSLEKV